MNILSLNFNIFFFLLTFLFLTADGETMDYNNPALNPVKIEFYKNKKPATILQAGKLNAIIVIPDKNKDHSFRWQACVPGNNSSQKYYTRGVAHVAAAELQRLLALATGNKIPIIHESQEIPSGKTIIYVGESSAAAKAGFDNKKIKTEGFRITCKNSTVAILGAPIPARQKGTGAWSGIYGVIFGVYDFLERFAGFRFYYPGKDGTIVPELKNLVIPALSYSDYPRFIRRQQYGWHLGMDKAHDWMRIALQYRAGGSGWRGATSIPQHQPTNVVANGMNPALDKNGNPNHKKPPMPCLGEPDAANKFISMTNAAIARKIPKKDYDRNGAMPNSRRVVFSPDDHPIVCHCSYCKKLFSRGPFHQQASRIYGKFIGEAAQRLKEEQPEAILHILPYYNYNSPVADLKLQDNVFAMVCMMYGTTLYHDPDIKKYSSEWIKGWRQATGRKVHVYMYPMWPFLRTLAPFPYQYYHNLKKFINDSKDDIDGAFVCNIIGNRVAGGFYSLYLPSEYCRWRLMWNPDYNVEAGVKDLCDKLYGPASESMYQLIELCAGIWEELDTVNIPEILKIGAYKPGEIPREKFFKQLKKRGVIEKLNKYVTAAEKITTKGSIYRNRVNCFCKSIRLFLKDYEMFCKNGSSKKTSASATYIAGDFMLDGKLNETFWKDIPSYNFVKSELSHSPHPKVKTTMKLAYNNTGLLLGFLMREPEIDKIKLHKTVWRGDSLEVILEYSPGSVYQFAINSANKIHDGFRVKIPPKRYDYVRRKIFVGKDFWSVEIFVPFGALGIKLPFDAAKSKWRGNFVRNRVLRNGKIQHFRWNTNFHRSNFDRSAFGRIEFLTQKKVR